MSGSQTPDKPPCHAVESDELVGVEVGEILEREEREWRSLDGKQNDQGDDCKGHEPKSISHGP